MNNNNDYDLSALGPMCISRHQPHLPRSDRVRAINLSLVLLMRTLGLRETWGVWCNMPSDLLTGMGPRAREVESGIEIR